MQFFRKIFARKITVPSNVMEQVHSEMVAKRDHHLAEMMRYEDAMVSAETMLQQHRRAYEAFNNTLFAIDNPARFER